jgi:hypothetical protein
MRRFVNKDHFQAFSSRLGEEAVITTAGGRTYSLRGIAEDLDDLRGPDQMLITGDPNFVTWFEWCLTVSSNDSIEIDGESFTIKEVKRDRSAGTVTLMLRRAA